MGKTSLIRQFVEKRFDDAYLSTVGVAISRKPMVLPTDDILCEKDVNLQLMIWDIEGRTKFYDVSPSYLQGADGAVIVGSLAMTDTIDALGEHVKSFHAVNPQSPVVVALNKVDLYPLNAVSPALAATPAVQAVYSTSAKTGQNVDTLFTTLAQTIITADGQSG